MNILEFMSNNPFLTFFVLLVIAFLVEITMKQINIFKHGWPNECTCEEQVERDNK